LDIDHIAGRNSQGLRDPRSDRIRPEFFMTEAQVEVPDRSHDGLVRFHNLWTLTASEQDSSENVFSDVTSVAVTGTDSLIPFTRFDKRLHFVQS
jgi:hypothetical protein